MISVVRWSQSERVLPGTEVDDEFVAHPDTVHLFAFTTDRMSVGEHTGKLSLKLVTHGLERFQIGRRSVALRPGYALVVNEGQSYSSSIDEPGTRSISFFLPTAVAAEAFQAARAFDTAPSGAEPDVLQVPFRADPTLAAGVGSLSEAVARPGEPELDHLHGLVLEVATDALARAGGLVDPGVLPECVHRATREELVARVLRARDLIFDTHGRTTLTHMAFEAGLSKYHFLRTFQRVFGTTPARFAQGVRLARGRERLARGDSPTVAARAAGYRSVSAFLRAVRTASAADPSPSQN